jgi:transcriptional regulator with PAS, ATPase and Fis domain
VFLDEIAEIPMDLQGRFLRVLQEKEVMRIGDDKVIPIDVRIISASNKKLRELVKEGKFRSDLYYRIGILKINIPSLNERKEDIILLTEHFIKKFAKLYSKKIKKISDSSLEYLMDYDYEGNVRELEGIVEKAVILCEGDEINIEDIIVDDENINQAIEKYNIHYFNIDYGVSLKKLNEEYIKYVLSKENNNYKRASEILEIDRSTLWRRINKK